MSEKKEESFLRRVIWLLLALSISSAGGWIWTIAGIQSQVNHNSNAVKQIQELQQTMLSIDKGVTVLVAEAKIRNETLSDLSKKAHYTYSEQKRRLPIIKRVQRHMDDRGLHR